VEWFSHGAMAKAHNPEQSMRDLQFFGEEGGVVPVIDVAATSTFMKPEDMERAFRGEIQGCHVYSRQYNPSVSIFSKKMAALEKTQAAVGVASGMAAISSAIGQLVQNGDHIVCSRTIYGGTYALFAHHLPRHGVEVTFVDNCNLAEVKKSIKENTKIIYTESISNPLLEVPDLEALAQMAHNAKAKLMVDNTFAPFVITPALWGADIVIHSATKFISGQADMIAGVICGSQEFIDSLMDINTGSVMLNGPVLDPRLAHELYMRLDHLSLRMKAHGEIAQLFAQRIKEMNFDVSYPTLATHKTRDNFLKISNSGYYAGGVITLDCQTRDKARLLAEKLQDEKFGLYAVSLGFSRTLMSCPGLSTSSEIPEGERAKLGMKDSLLRLSLGFSGDKEVMWKKLESSLKLLRI
jgi:methionine-gamma-lyase